MSDRFAHQRALDLVSGLATPDVYPGRPPSVEVHETHGSWVFVAGEHALKIKRPVKLAFLDYSTLERRRAMCREEVRLNRRLAPRVYLRTVGIVQDPGGGFALSDDDEAAGVVEVGVLMRRYDEAAILAARLAAGTATSEQLRAVGARIATFHAASPRPGQAETALATLRQAVRTTLDDLEAARLAPPAGARVPTLRNRLEVVLSSRREDVLARGRRGLVVDGHGDLRLQHVLLTDPVQVLDALEFDPGLRIIDVACDIGFLVMDLEGEGATALAEALLTDTARPAAIRETTRCWRSWPATAPSYGRRSMPCAVAPSVLSSGSRRRRRWAGARGARCSSRSAALRRPGSPRSRRRCASRARWSACPPTSSARDTSVWRAPGEHRTAPTTTTRPCAPTARLASRPPRRWPPAAAP